MEQLMIDPHLVIGIVLETPAVSVQSFMLHCYQSFRISNPFGIIILSQTYI